MCVCHYVHEPLGGGRACAQNGTHTHTHTHMTQKTHTYTGTVPHERFVHRMAALDDRLLLFGGRTMSSGLGFGVWGLEFRVGFGV